MVVGAVAVVARAAVTMAAMATFRVAAMFVAVFVAVVGGCCLWLCW